MRTEVPAAGRIEIEYYFRSGVLIEFGHITSTIRSSRFTLPASDEFSGPQDQVADRYINQLCLNAGRWHNDTTQWDAVRPAAIAFNGPVFQAERDLFTRITYHNRCRCNTDGTGIHFYIAGQGRSGYSRVAISTGIIGKFTPGSVGFCIKIVDGETDIWAPVFQVHQIIASFRRGSRICQESIDRCRR